MSNNKKLNFFYYFQLTDPPVVSIASNTYQAPWGNSVTLVCTVSANPTHTSVSWKKIQNGVVTNIVPSNNPSKYEGSTVSSPSLIIKNADRNSDQAFYECAATNTIGTGTSSRTFLTVTGGMYESLLFCHLEPVQGQSFLLQEG